MRDSLNRPVAQSARSGRSVNLGWARVGLLAALLAVVLSGCGSEGTSGALAVGASPQAGAIAPCSPMLKDAWSFTVAAGDDVMISVDTVDAGTTADFELRGSCEDADTFFGDDNFLCTFPPPEFSCPAASFVAAAQTRCVVDVSPALASISPATSACADDSRAEYQLDIEINGQPAVLSLLRENTDMACIGGPDNGRSCGSEDDCEDGSCVSTLSLPGASLLTIGKP